MKIYLAHRIKLAGRETFPCASPEVAELVRQLIAREYWQEWRERGDLDRPYEDFADPRAAADFYFARLGEHGIEHFEVDQVELLDEVKVKELAAA